MEMALESVRMILEIAEVLSDGFQAKIVGCFVGFLYLDTTYYIHIQYI